VDKNTQVTLKNIKQPTNFSTKPTVRPTYIPQTVVTGSTTRPVYYDRGGYGFWDEAGKWILISSVVNSMNQPQRVYVNNTGYTDSSYGYSANSNETGLGATLIIFTLIVVVGIIVIVAYGMKRRI
jgi:hypothetical protein